MRARPLLRLAAPIALPLAVLFARPAPAAAAEPAPRHLIYLHGRIVQEQQSPRPRHPRFGHYELEAILSAFRERGLVVRGGIRPKTASVDESAAEVADEVRRLLASGVPADRVTIVGASMGASIALGASSRLRKPELRVVLLGACLSASVREMPGEGPSGRFLSIREASDELTEPCAAWRSDGDPLLPLEAREILLHT
ncbi:MAG TPA: hypothetical protein VGB87_21375, partial [Vicinamibacteria bacterium]